VVLELEWVLRAFYGFDASDFVRVIEHLLGLPNVGVEEWPRVADALVWHREGMDFADALHLRASNHCDEFFPRKFSCDRTRGTGRRSKDHL
jgi:predicted nucleic-acid-binding protein